MEVITKSQAKALGLRKYFTGVACKHGHVGERYISGSCIECTALKSKVWYSDPIKKVNRRLSMREKNRIWRKANPDRVKATKAKHYLKYKDKIIAKSVAWESANAKKCAERKARNRRERVEQYRAYYRNRKHRLKVGGKHTGMEIKDIIRLQRGKCGYCKIKFGDKYHVDHIVPVSAGGSNERRNLQILCIQCNLSKHARDPIAFAQSRGMLV